MAKKNETKKTEEEIDEEDQSKLQDKEESPSESKEESSQDEDEGEDSELDKLNKDLERKDEEIIELKSHIQRLQADFDNFRKQGEKQKQDLIRYANEGLIVKFLDDMERALENSSNEEELREGLELIYSKMKNALEKEGVEEIPAVGEKFDPFKHEALLTVDSPDHENNEIVDELMKGYTLKDKVIKYSKVRVCKKAKKEE